jgi:4a-hydroxytetrahydrobiopterin dehydratase
MNPIPLTDAEIARALAALPGWRRDDDALTAELRFPSFAAAVGWMAGLSEAIDGLDHHPEWTNVYDRVRIRCTTHDAGNRITARDAALAKLIAWRHAQEYGP